MSTLLAPGTHTIIIDLARACPNSSTTSINLYQHELGYGTVLQDLEAELRRHCMMVTAQAAASTDAPLPAVLLVDWRGACQWIVEPHSTLECAKHFDLLASVQGIAQQSLPDTRASESWDSIDVDILRLIHRRALEDVQRKADLHTSKQRDCPIVWWLSSSLRCAALIGTQASYLIEQLFRLGVDIRHLHVGDPIAVVSTAQCESVRVASTVEHIAGEPLVIRNWLANMRPVLHKAIRLQFGAPLPYKPSRQSSTAPPVSIDAVLSPLAHPPLQLQLHRRCKAHERNVESTSVDSITSIAQLEQYRAHVTASCSAAKTANASKLHDMLPAVQYGPLRCTPKPNKRQPVARMHPSHDAKADGAISDGWWQDVGSLYITELLPVGKVADAIHLMYGKPLLCAPATDASRCGDSSAHDFQALITMLRSKQLALVAEAHMCHDALGLTVDKHYYLLVPVDDGQLGQQDAHAFYVHPVASREMRAQLVTATLPTPHSTHYLNHTAPVVAAEVRATLDTLPTLNKTQMSELSNGTADLLDIFQRQGRAIRTAM